MTGVQHVEHQKVIKNSVRVIVNVVFDLGGVVLGRGFADNGYRIKGFEFIQGDRTFPEFWKRFDLGEMSMDEVAAEIARKEDRPVAEARGQVERIMDMFDEFPCTVQLIKELSDRGYGLYVLSNMPREFYDNFRRFEAFDYFDGVVISSLEKLSKPDPRFFAILSERYGLIPAETLFVDDKASNTSVAVGLGFNVFRFDPENGPDAVRKILAEGGAFG